MLAGCASTTTAPPAASATPTPPARWQAPLPHGGQVGRPAALVAAVRRPAAGPADRRRAAGQPDDRRSARRASSRRAPLASPAGAALLPTLDAAASASRGRATLLRRSAPAPRPACRRVGARPVRRQPRRRATPPRRASRARRPPGTTRGCRSPPKSPATYIALRACEAQVAQTRLDADFARRDLAPDRAQRAQAGFQPPAERRAGARQRRPGATQS